MIYGFNESIVDCDLVGCIYSDACDAKKSQNLKILFFIKQWRIMHFLQQVISKVNQQFFGNKVCDKEVIFLKQLLKCLQVTGLVAVDNILEDEHNPLGDVHFEKSVFPD